MNISPLISVIVPVYNKEDLLSRCIESVLKQSFIDFELILINDGSTDSSGELCVKWQERDKRIIVLHQKNAGVSAARNKGLDCAKGKYIVFVDSDDWVKPEYLSHLLAEVPETSKRGLIIQGFSSYHPNDSVFDAGMRFEKASASSDNILLMAEKFNLGECGFPFSKLYNRSLIQQYSIRFDERIYMCEDLLFMYDYILHADYLVLGEKQDYAYVKYPNSLSALLHTFNMEYLCFTEYQKRVQSLTNKYNILLDDLPNLITAMMKSFQRAMKTDYQLYRKADVSRKERLANLRKLILSNYDIMRRYYHPVCKSDKLGKFLLMYKYFILYDIYIRFLFKLGFVPVFRGPVKI